MDNRFQKLKNGIVLAELGGYGDGKFCAVHGRGAALVMLGTYIVDDDEVDYPKEFVLRRKRPGYLDYLKKNIAIAAESGAPVGVSVVSIDDVDNIDFLLAAQKAGADYLSYCAHSTMEMFMDTATSSAMLLKENQEHLKRFTGRLLERLSLPLIFKIGAFDNDDAAAAVELLIREGISAFHINIERCSEGWKGLQFLQEIKRQSIFIIASGGIKDEKFAERILEYGADAAAIGTAAVKDPEICGRIQEIIRNK